MTALLEKYADFHQIMLTADGNSVRFYEGLGFAKAGSTVPMWIYAGQTINLASFMFANSRSAAEA